MSHKSRNSCLNLLDNERISLVYSKTVIRKNHHGIISRKVVFSGVLPVRIN